MAGRPISSQILHPQRQIVCPLLHQAGYFNQDIFSILSHKRTFQNKITAQEWVIECWPDCWWNSLHFPGRDESASDLDTWRFFIVNCLCGNNINPLPNYTCLTCLLKGILKMFSSLLSNTAVRKKRPDPFMWKDSETRWPNNVAQVTWQVCSLCLLKQFLR